MFKFYDLCDEQPGDGERVLTKTMGGKFDMTTYRAGEVHWYRDGKPVDSKLILNWARPSEYDAHYPIPVVVNEREEVQAFFTNDCYQAAERYATIVKGIIQMRKVNPFEDELLSDLLPFSLKFHLNEGRVVGQIVIRVMHMIVDPMAYNHPWFDDSDCRPDVGKYGEVDLKLWAFDSTEALEKAKPIMKELLTRNFWENLENGNDESEKEICDNDA